ncbi:MAG: hypothetical protein KL801_09445 [Mesorhizobium sp.]|nr:hypothetical protein [Mesorhizobium sp.]
MLARTPRTAICLAKPQEKPKRLNRDRQKGIRDKIVAIMRTVEPTPFAAEGPCRAGIRASLCLQGWAWANADAVAAEIVAAALNIAGARRPTWYEGQPEYTQPGALPILRERCIRCRGPLPVGHYKFCSKVCSDGYHADRGNAHAAAERLAANEAGLAAWSRK